MSPVSSIAPPAVAIRSTQLPVVAPAVLRRAGRMQELEAHAVPVPRLPGGAARGAAASACSGWACGSDECSASTSQGFQHREGAAYVVAVFVAEHHGVEARETPAARKAGTTTRPPLSASAPNAGPAS